MECSKAARPQEKTSFVSAGGIRYLQKLPIPERERFIVDKLLEEISNLKQLKAEFDTYIKSIDFHSEDMSFLRTVPALYPGMLFPAPRIARDVCMRSCAWFKKLNPDSNK